MGCHCTFYYMLLIIIKGYYVEVTTSPLKPHGLEEPCGPIVEPLLNYFYVQWNNFIKKSDLDVYDVYDVYDTKQT